jgi:hypothetical protein
MSALKLRCSRTASIHQVTPKTVKTAKKNIARISPLKDASAAVMAQQLPMIGMSQGFGLCCHAY